MVHLWQSEKIEDDSLRGSELEHVPALDLYSVDVKLDWARHRRTQCLSGPQPDSIMAEDRSETQWIQDLKRGDDEGAALLWRRYFMRMARLARRKLPEGRRRAQDEHDIAIEAFQSLCEGARKGHFEDLQDREGLWKLIATITQRKVAQHQRHEMRAKRGRGEVRGHSIVDGVEEGFDWLVGKEPDPHSLQLLAEEQHRLLERLEDPLLRKIAVWKMEGWTGEEIAGKLDLTRRSVERKLNRIRTIWKEEWNT